MPLHTEDNALRQVQASSGLLSEKKRTNEKKMPQVRKWIVGKWDYVYLWRISLQETRCFHEGRPPSSSSSCLAPSRPRMIPPRDRRLPQINLKTNKQTIIN